MMAAIGAGHLIPGKNIIIIEKNDIIGRKLLATGNGRCNITNARCRSTDYSKGSKEKETFVQRAFDTFGRDETLRLFNKIGLMVREEEDGREYPYDGQASTVREVMEANIKSMGIRIITGTTIRNIEKVDNKFALITEDERLFHADKVIISTGGKAGMQYGSTGEGYRFARDFGLKTIRPRPALVKIVVDYQNFNLLKGTRAKGNVSLISEGEVKIVAKGEIQFTENALSGICIFDISRYYHNNLAEPVIEIDLFPDFSREGLTTYLCNRAKNLKDRNVRDFLNGMLHRKLVPFYFERWTDTNGTVSTLSDDDIDRLAMVLKSWKINVVGTAGWKEGQVTVGGIDVSQISPYTMEVEKIEGLYITGELLDVEGPCGGWNLQWAWTSGYLAGMSAADGAM